ncbi:Cell division protein FtsI [Peptidoglycan synthetase] [hydrothermal vent metagenome]|uniref:beta-lactamase n=1 Tax=hydrothermal vent metagenome TaxID=652676 RepID=A0A3B0UXA4_9ZZZZ
MRYQRQTARRGRGWLWLFIILLAVAGYFLWYVTSYHRAPSGVKKAVRPRSAKVDKFIAAESPLRRDIYDRNMRPLALSIRSYSVNLRPMELKPGPAGIKQLRKIPGLHNRQIAGLRNGQASVQLKKYISAAEADRIARLKISGIHLRAAEHRFYPYGDAAAQVIGFTKDGQGLAGVEFTYDSVLTGDLLPASRVLKAAGINISNLTGGAAVVLSLDVKLQMLLEKTLKGLIKKRGAGSAMALLLNAADGRIEALANIPSYDPNRYWQYDSFNRRNRALKDPVLLGGMFRYLQIAAALRSGLLKPPSLNGSQKVIAHLVPRFMKLPVRGVTGLNKGVWQKIQDGVYYGPGLGAMQEITAALPPRLVVNALDGLVDTAFTTTDITPLTPVSLVDLTAVFGRLINGGKGLRPHLLDGLRLDGSKKILAADFKTAAAVDHKYPGREFLNILRKGRNGAKGPIVLESLLTAADKEAASIEFKEAGTAGKQGIEPPPEKKVIYNSLSMGIQTGRTPLVLLIALEGLTKPGSGSLCGAAIGRILRGRRRIYRRKLAVRPVRRDYFAVWQRWRIKHERAAKRERAKSTTGVMPDVRGYSLRRALRRLSGLKVRLVISGAGQVKWQQPRPGVRLRDNELCRLRLRFLEVKQRVNEHFGSGTGKAVNR